MKILVLGSGGREHALCWRLARDGHEIICAPGNPGTAEEANVSNVQLDLNSPQDAIQLAQDLAVDLVVPGPEVLVALGVSDMAAEKHIPCAAPVKAGAQLESSKAFAKDFFTRNHIPTASWQSFEASQEEQAIQYAVKELGGKVAIKADGLAAGKGVVLAQDADSVQREVARMLQGETVGDAGNRIVIEELLQGEEVSYTVLTDGVDYLCLPSSQDHKARDQGDQGPNTGGMGAYSPAPVLDDAWEEVVRQQVLLPTLKGLRDIGIRYRGVLYFGLMLTTKACVYWRSTADSATPRPKCSYQGSLAI